MKTAKRMALIVAAAILLSGSALSAGVTSAEAATVVSVKAGADSRKAAERILHDVNAFRAKNGFAPLLLSPKLNSISQKWSETMAAKDYLDSNPDYFTLMPEGSWSGGESVMQCASYTEVVQALSDSPSHRSNLLGDYTHIGIGYAVNKYGQPYSTLDFGYYDSTTTPTAIRTPETEAGDSDFTVSWTPKADEQVTNYVIQVWRPDGTLLAAKTSTKPKAAFTGLNGNTAYTVGVEAQNIDRAGVEHRSPIKKHTVLTLKDPADDTPSVAAPTGPVGFNATTKSYNKATLTWNNPTGIIGYITGYTVTLKQAGKADRTFKINNPSTKSIKIKGLEENTTYTAKVVANVISTDKTKTVTSPAASIKLKTTFSVASIVKVSAPSSLRTVAGKTTLTATWKAPKVTGKLKSYTVTLKKGTKVVKTYTTKSTKAVFSGLKANSGYKVEVKANAVSSNDKHTSSSTVKGSFKTLR